MVVRQIYGIPLSSLLNSIVLNLTLLIYLFHGIFLLSIFYMLILYHSLDNFPQLCKDINTTILNYTNYVYFLQ